MTKTTLTLLAALAASASTFAQDPANGTTGLLGARYGEVSYSFIDVHGLEDNIHSGGIGFNLPLGPRFDVGFGYDYSRLKMKAIGATLRGHTVSAGITAYTEYGALKPFVSGGLGHEWTKVKVGGLSSDDSTSVYGVSAGFEAAVGSFTVTPSISYTDSFENGSSGDMSYGVEVNRWLTPKVGAYAGVGYNDELKSNDYSWTMTIGLRMRL